MPDPDKTLLVVGQLPKPWAEMTDAERGEWSLTMAESMNAQRDALLDAAADSGPSPCDEPDRSRSPA